MDVSFLRGWPPLGTSVRPSFRIFLNTATIITIRFVMAMVRPRLLCRRCAAEWNIL